MMAVQDADTRASVDSSSGRGARFSLAFRIYVTGLVMLCVAALPSGVLTALDYPGAVVLWIVMSWLANLLTIPMLPRLKLEASLGPPVSVAAAVIFPWDVALLITLLGFTAQHELRREVSLWLSAFNRAQDALCAGAAAVGAAVVAMVMPAGDPLETVAETVAAAVVYNLANVALLTTGVRLRFRVDLSDAARRTSEPVPHFAVVFGFVTLLALLFVVLYTDVGAWSLALLGFPVWLGYSALRSGREAEDKAEELVVRVRELETLNALSSQLLTARQVEQAATVAIHGLRTALARPEVQLSVEGDIDPALHVVKIRGVEPCAIGVPNDLGDRSLAVVEAVAGLVGMALQRLELERELAENEKALSRLSGRILEEGTLERSRIALEIHDEVLPSFAAAQIQADNARSALAKGDPERADALTGLTLDAIHAGIARLREALETLRRQIVVPGGLREALQSSLSQLSLEHGVDGRLESPQVLPPLPLAVEILVLETVRGCLANVMSHASANRVDLSVAATDGVLYVQVRDDGRGFDPARVGSGHYGLVLMRQRVELVRGRFDVQSSPGKGTTVRLEVPV